VGGMAAGGDGGEGRMEQRRRDEGDEDATALGFADRDTASWVVGLLLGRHDGMSFCRRSHAQTHPMHILCVRQHNVIYEQQEISQCKWWH
jgi:hypothetical protein